jgi:probable phosphoglycerate mutase
MPRRHVFLTRHGETDWNAEGRWQGHTDIPLNANGRAQARALAEFLRGSGIPAIVSSDLARAHETATIIGSSLGIALAYTDPGLRERMFGVFEGLTRADCERLHPEAWRAWLEEQRLATGVEAPESVAARVTAAIGRAVDRVGRDDVPVLLVTHGGALRSAVRIATGMQPPPIANCAVWRVDWDGAIVGARAVSPDATD